jgi:hypothetical protein
MYCQRLHGSFAGSSRFFPDHAGVSPVQVPLREL